MALDAIFIMGPQGCGKGTQAKILAEKLGFFHWEMGGILRAMADYRLKDGETPGAIMRRGMYLTDEQLEEILVQKLGELDLSRGVIFEGVPRRIGQAEFLFDYLRDRGKSNFLTIYIDIPYAESIRRIMARAKVENRADDTEEGMRQRLKNHTEATLPILDYMKQQSKFVQLDGLPPIPEVAQKIFEAVDED